MLALKEYEVNEVLYEGDEIIIYRGLHKSNPVIIKANRPEFFIPRIIAKLQHEFEITRNITSTGILKPDLLINYANGMALVFPDHGGISLSEFIKTQKIHLSNFLKIAIQLSEILGNLHSHNIIHKDIKPQNVIILPKTLEVKLIDFGISSKISLKIQSMVNPDVLEGTLAYISPEQTGRMNRIVDYRTDFYSLGVLLYELIVNKLPFQTNDSIEMVHSHLAVTPDSPSKVKPDIPPIISDIILKLLSKNAEDRYNSGFGLKADLIECQKQYNTKESIDLFPLGTQDFSGRFQIRQKLYGREEDIQKFMNSFQNASLGGKEIMLVSGYSGVGKSALVSELHKPITSKRGFFVSGKYDQFQKNLPYFAIRQAFEEFIKLLLTEKKKSLEEWKKIILDSVGTNGKVLVDIFPNLELILGELPEIPALGPQESQIRFNLVFQNFIRAICRREHPLVVFIDDLQWADSASLNLLNLILSDSDIRYLLLICAYRDNEVDSSHPFSILIDSLKKKNINIESVSLSNLKIQDVNTLISDSLSTKPEKTIELTELVFKKTAGNAFFTTEFLKSLYEEELLTYHFQENEWSWDVQRIISKNMTDNVVILMMQKLEKLSFETKKILQYASCIGNKFTLRIISIILEKSPKDTLKELWSAIEEDLIIPLDDNYKSIEISNNDIESEFKFVHDRVQQASYNLIGEDHKKEIHLKIGRLLFSNTSEENLSEKVFDIVNQFNNSLELLTDEKEKLQIAKLNLTAALKARSSAAYEGAKSYLNKIMIILSDKTWVEDYDLILQAHYALIEIEFLKNNPERAEELSEIVLKKAHSSLDRIRIFELKTYYYNKIGEFAQALDMVVNGLKSINYKLKRKPKQVDIVLKLLKTKAVLGRYSYEKILNLPLLKDKTKLDAIKFYALGAPSAYMSEPNALPILTFESCMLTVKNGIGPSSSYAFALYGLICCGALDDIENGYKYGELSFKLWEKSKSREIEPRLRHIFFGLIRHWKYDLHSCIPSILETVNIAMNLGDMDYYAYSLCVYFAYRVYSGEHLKLIVEDYEKYTNLYKENMNAAIQFIAPNIEYSVKLMQPNIPNDFELDGKYFDANTHLPLMREINLTALAFYSVAQIHLAILFKDYELAMKWIEEARLSIDAASVGMYDQTRYYFFKGIVHAKLIQKNVGNKKSHLKELDFCIKKFKKWSSRCVVNHEYSYFLLKAFRFLVDKKIEEASEFFEKSVKRVEESGFVNDMGLVNEFVAEFYHEQNKIKVGNTYIVEALNFYMAWGAIAKVKHLREKYTELFGKETTFKNEDTRTITFGQNPTNANTRTTREGSSSRATTRLDIDSVVKISQALSGEIHIEKLFQKMMKILIENAGAERCYLILLDKNQFLIQAEGGVGLQEFPVKQSILVDNDDYVPLSLIEYVVRTKESVVLANASTDGNFVQSEYVIKNKPKSVICSPILKQGQIFGILYLENNLVSDAFTPDRLEILRILSSQVAISMENSLLYANLEQKVKERTDELSTALKKVEEIRLRQDGDYFLTSLLIEPLAKNWATSKVLKIDFFIEQKKQFQYKNKKLMIGGDINISQSFNIGGKQYTLFVNADAMGKSSQGAGGVLVFGTAFGVIMKRSKSLAANTNLTAVKFLSNTYKELHNVFLSFAGMMLMSMVMGIIEDETGLMYLINVEHPNTVLYRDAKSHFIEKRFTHHKLGSEGFESDRVQIHKVHLKKGDIIIAGSDGRDDVVINEEIGQINEDENLFLSAVERGNGYLENIVNIVKANGKLMDDFSMIRIEYLK